MEPARSMMSPRRAMAPFEARMASALACGIGCREQKGTRTRNDPQEQRDFHPSKPEVLCIGGNGAEHHEEAQ